MYVKLESGSIEKLRDKELLLFGAGSLGLRSIEECEKVNAKVLGFVDNNRQLRGTKLEKYTIYAPEDIYKFSDITILIVSTYKKEIEKQLELMGVMNVEIICLGALRDVIEKEDFYRPLLNKEEANEYIYKNLLNDKPIFVGRLGSNELECMVEYQYLLERISGGTSNYHNNLKLVMKQGAGFFPTEEEYLDRLATLYISDLGKLDFVWSMWLSRFENLFYKEYASKAEIGFYEDTVLPCSCSLPWTRALEHKKVLVIHPFTESIQKNYKYREKLFDNPYILPEFDLILLKSVQSIGEESTEFQDWFAALDSMKRQINQIDFDIALIGAGAYGFPLGAYIKDLGKKAIHIGGYLQLFFGIKGKAWNRLGLYNQYWTSPREDEHPKGYLSVEAGRYW